VKQWASKIFSLQLVLNIAAHLTFKGTRALHISLLLQQIKRLPTEKRIDEKSLTLAFETCKALGPSWIAKLLCAWTLFMRCGRLEHRLWLSRFILWDHGCGVRCHVLFSQAPYAATDAITPLLRSEVFSSHHDGLSCKMPLVLPSSVPRRALLERANSSLEFWVRFEKFPTIHRAWSLKLFTDIHCTERIALYCIVLCCILLHCIVLYCIVLSYRQSIRCMCSNASTRRYAA